MLNSRENWQEKIRDWAEALGFVAIGFTSAEEVLGLADYLQERQRRGLATSFEGENLAERSDPQRVWPACRSVVALAHPLPLSSSPLVGQGILARSAVGEDYHRVVKRKLQELIELMLAEGWDSEVPHLQVDTGPLVERALAVRAGLGWIGKNQLLIVPGYGSFVALALLLLDQEFEPDVPLSNQCGECRKCLQACPAQILGEQDFAAGRCFSYLTQSKQLNLADGLKLGNRIFGCDTCQEVCPYNQERIELEKTGRLEKPEAPEAPETIETIETIETRETRETLETLETLERPAVPATPELRRGVDLIELLDLTKGRFDEEYRTTAAGWRGKGLLQRNAYLALRYQGDPRLAEWIRNKGKDLPPSIQGYVE